MGRHLAARLAGWGRCPVVAGIERRSEDLETLTRDAPLSRGAGRSYGDASLPASSDSFVAGTVLADRMIDFDPGTLTLTAEAGLSLDTICRQFPVRGYFVPVSPGTRFVTLGGMVAADVHGKNHHSAGTIGAYVRSLRIRVGTGDVVSCSRTQHADLFWATVGGMGLTGHILEVSVRLDPVPSPWIIEERRRVDDIDEMVAALADASARWPMTAGWIDGLADGAAFGRGMLYCGRWAEPQESPSHAPLPGRTVNVPLDAPDALLSSFTVGRFNWLTARRQRRRVARHTIPFWQFFYPLDSVGHWHRLYGKRGFVQYQCVLPSEVGVTPARRLLETLRRLGGSPFLCVIKDCGEEGNGLLSFPRPGVSLAIDMPVDGRTQAVIDGLNDLVIENGGRIYLAKDALTRPEHFRRMEPRLERFLAVRRAWDPEGRIRSAQSQRLYGW